MRAHRSAFETQAPPAGARAASQFTDVRRQRFSHVDQSIRVSIAAHAVQRQLTPPCTHGAVGARKESPGARPTQRHNSAKHVQEWPGARRPLRRLTC